MKKRYILGVLVFVMLWVGLRANVVRAEITTTDTVIGDTSGSDPNLKLYSVIFGQINLEKDKIDFTKKEADSATIASILSFVISLIALNKRNI